MVFFNYSTMQMAAKIVYYGPGLCGKTTNLHCIYNRTAAGSRGEMVSLETETDRTLFFDLLPIDVGQISGFTTRIQLYTVPGQVFYNTTRKLVLKGVDGVVFVADSQRAMEQANIESFLNLEENLGEMGLSTESVPLVLQYNKRDLPDILGVEELDRALNRGGWPAYEASALHSEGVFETLKGISKLTLLSLRRRLARGGEGAGAEAGRPPAMAIRSPSGAHPTARAPAGGPPAARPASGPHPAHPPHSVARPPAAAAPPSAPARPAPAAGGKATARRAVDVDGELDRLRRESLAGGGPALRPAGRGNGSGEITRSIELTLKRADYERARRFTLSLAVEDGANRVVDEVRGLAVDFDDPRALAKVLLRLKIALQAEE
jgi:signal recognition particle receptor subunit beta